MKIKKSSKVKACNEPLIQQPLTQSTPLAQVVGEVGTDHKANACCYIQSAISELSTIASVDSIAKESLANLAVVLLDLQ